MLVLTRKANQQLLIGNDIVITVVKVRGNTIRLGIEAPRDVRVVRSELDAKPETKAGDAAGSDASVTISDLVGADLMLELPELRGEEVSGANRAPSNSAEIAAKPTTLKAFANSKFKQSAQADRNLEDSPLCHANRRPQRASKIVSMPTNATGGPISGLAPLVNVTLSSLTMVSHS